MRWKWRLSLTTFVLAFGFMLAQSNPSQDRIAGLTADDLARGKKIYNGQCALCHGIGGVGGRGPALNLTKLDRAANGAALFKIIKEGIRGSEMPQFWMLTDAEIWQVAGYVRSLGGAEPVKLPGDLTRGRQVFEWKMGGAATWVTGSYDPALNLIYWGTGNPGPDWNGDVRPGDNLYTCSLLAIDAANGKIKWHFQYTPHDTHDWDATEIPVLLDAEVNGRERKLVAMANRNAFYYLLDRVTGEFLLGEPYAKQTWARGLDAKGRPIVLPNTEPSVEGTLVWPALNGATNWYSPSYSPLTSLFYVSVRERSSYYYKGEVEFKPGTFFAGGGERPVDGDDKAWGAIRALEASTGKLKWEFRLQTPPWAGVLATAGGLVFSGSNEGNFYALDARTGKPLWDFQTGATIAANPISFLIDGKQHVAIASGQSLFVFGLP